MAAAASGCEVIIAVDVHPMKLEMAKKCGATHVVDGKDRPAERILEITGGLGVDFGIESAGFVETIEQCYRSVRKGGGRAVIAGNPKQGERISIDPFDLISGRQISGTWGGETNPERDFPEYVRLHAEGRLPIEKMITDRFPLTKINEAIQKMESGQAGRVLIDTQG
jgi:S-(hydroxymethyl)glutathione dehydrogenase/alcohol dehydrogenase